MSSSAGSVDAREAVTRNPLWYHTIDVAPGVTTPGVFDLRPVVEACHGRTCAASAASTWAPMTASSRSSSSAAARPRSWPPTSRTTRSGTTRSGSARQSTELLETIAGEKGEGFEIARELLGSRVEKVEINAYDLSSERVGQFDVVVCGSLLLHLRDPLRALAAIRSVCTDRFMSIEQVDFLLSRIHPRRPLVRIDGTSGASQWWVANEAGHVRMLEAAGFDVERRTPMYIEPFGVGHPDRERGRGPRAALAASARRASARLLGRGDGVPHAAVLTRRA